MAYSRVPAGPNAPALRAVSPGVPGFAGRGAAPIPSGDFPDYLPTGTPDTTNQDKRDLLETRALSESDLRVVERTNRAVASVAPKVSGFPRAAAAILALVWLFALAASLLNAMSWVAAMPAVFSGVLALLLLFFTVNVLYPEIQYFRQVVVGVTILWCIWSGGFAALYTVFAVLCYLNNSTYCDPQFSPTQTVVAVGFDLIVLLVTFITLAPLAQNIIAFDVLQRISMARATIIHSKFRK